MLLNPFALSHDLHALPKANSNCIFWFGKRSTEKESTPKANPSTTCFTC
ncbi:hypothetical protein ANMWB30_23490 [Arthrobacter sp. MWB30]|nr:hypothetical protein ANMWB30_23490 [Arthrobacter sp. MWB30]